jgi:hypothetical protein
MAKFQMSVSSFFLQKIVTTPLPVITIAHSEAAIAPVCFA